MEKRLRHRSYEIGQEIDRAKKMREELPESLLRAVASWLGDDGRKFFEDITDQPWGVALIYTSSKIPHPVHFREGMQVRNFLRDRPECKGWSTNEFDSRWAPIVRASLGLDEAKANG